MPKSRPRFLQENECGGQVLPAELKPKSQDVVTNVTNLMEKRLASVIVRLYFNCS